MYTSRARNQTLFTNTLRFESVCLGNCVCLLVVRVLSFYFRPCVHTYTHITHILYVYIIHIRRHCAFNNNTAINSHKTKNKRLNEIRLLRPILDLFGIVVVVVVFVAFMMVISINAVNAAVTANEVNTSTKNKHIKLGERERERGREMCKFNACFFFIIFIHTLYVWWLFFWWSPTLLI